MSHMRRSIIATAVLFPLCSAQSHAPVGDDAARTERRDLYEYGRGVGSMGVRISEPPSAPRGVPWMPGPGPAGRRPPAPPHQPATRLPPESQPPAPPLDLEFDGITNTSWFPPDPTIAAGPAKLLPVVNGGIALLTKTGTNLVQKTLTGFYGTLHALAPKTLYDHHAGHFVTIAINGMAAPDSFIELAVSKTDDPANLDIGTTASDAWWKWNIDADLNGGQQTNLWADFPGLGVDQHHLYITANMFDDSIPPSFQYVKLWIIPKAQLYAGQTTITWYEFWNLLSPVTGQPVCTVQPAHTYCTGALELLVNASDTSDERLIVWYVLDPITTPWLHASALDVPSWNGFSVPAAQQLGGNEPIHTGDTRMLHAVSRNGSLWCTHTVPSPDGQRTQVRWYEIQFLGNLTPRQHGDISDVSTSFFCPAITVTKEGNAALVFSGASPNMYASSHYAARMAGDPAGTMSDPGILKNGIANYVRRDGQGRNRWGDYGGIALDPADEMRVWVFHEYAEFNNTWGTWIGRLPLASVLPPPGSTARVTVDSGGRQSCGAVLSGWSSVSGDGRLIAFSSAAQDLVPHDRNGTVDVFVRNHQSGTTVRASGGSFGQEANGYSSSPSISGSGRFVAFQSSATNLVSGDTNATHDIFVHDLQTDATTRVSVNSAGTQANGLCLDPSIFHEGRFVAFDSRATNLVRSDTNEARDVFVHDRLTGHTTRVSVDSNGNQAGGPYPHSLDPVISADGNRIVYLSYASDLVANDTNGAFDIFVHDRTTGQTMRVSVDSAGLEANRDSAYPCISGDGSVVAFESYASNLVAGDTNGQLDVFLHTIASSETARASVSTTGEEANSWSRGPAMSFEGRYVGFVSGASNLIVGDTNLKYDVFVYDGITAETNRISIGTDGGEGNENSQGSVAMSNDGHFVTFSSAASNLVPGDANNNWDVFIRDRLQGIRAPSNLGCQASNCTSITLYWDDLSNNEGGFAVFRSVDCTGSFVEVQFTGPSETTWTDTNVSACSSYCYRVAARNAVVQSGYSNTAQCMTSCEPVIVQQPANAMTCDGIAHRFCVVATGGGVLAYQWRRDGSNIGGATSACYDATEAGSYACEVSDVCGTVLSSAATLSVWPSGSGDVTSDGRVDGLDIGPFVGIVVAGPSVPPSQAGCAADMNGDGVVDLADVLPFVNTLVGP